MSVKISRLSREIDEIPHQFEKMVEITICWYLQGKRIIPLGFLGGALHGVRFQPQ